MRFTIYDLRFTRHACRSERRAVINPLIHQSFNPFSHHQDRLARILPLPLGEGRGEGNSIFHSRTAPRPTNPLIHQSINPLFHPPSSILHPPSRRAFSLVEILVTVGILSFIIIGLLAMFNQTQKAFRNGMTQSDILESGRAVTEMMARELEQMTPSQLPFTTNFMAEVALPTRLANGFEPQYFPQDLPGDNVAVPQQRTNIFEHFFFLTHENLTWTGIGYLVDTPANGFGSLYRFQAQTTNSLYPDQVRSLASNFNFAAWALYSQNAFLSNFLQNPNPLAPTLTRVADGVVDLRIRPYSPSGYPLNTTNYLLNGTISNQRIPFPLNLTEKDCFFWSNAVPSYLELQIGFMEDRTLARLKAMPSVANVQSNYLRAHPANVHLFRQRVAVRNVDLTAYPYP